MYNKNEHSSKSFQIFFNEDYNSLCVTTLYKHFTTTKLLMAHQFMSKKMTSRHFLVYE